MMTLVKASALTLGFVCAIGFGIWIGPRVTHRAPTVAAATATAEPAAAPASRPAPAREAIRPATPMVQRVALSSPRLRDRVRPVLNRGTNMALAAQGFKSAEQFATVAHAAHNSKIPFILLKHRVLVDHKPLAVAIKESRPEVNGPVEANLARAEALADLAARQS